MHALAKQFQKLKNGLDALCQKHRLRRHRQDESAKLGRPQYPQLEPLSFPQSLGERLSLPLKNKFLVSLLAN